MGRVEEFFQPNQNLLGWEIPNSTLPITCKTQSTQPTWVSGLFLQTIFLLLFLIEMGACVFLAL